MRRTVHAAAAQAAAATMSMAAVQRSMAAATWNQGPGTHLQGVVEEDEESEQESGEASVQTQQTAGAQHCAEDLEVSQTLSHFVVGSYTQKGSLRDNEDRLSAAIWGVEPECRRASAALTSSDPCLDEATSNTTHSATQTTHSALASHQVAAEKAKARIAQLQEEAAILGVAAGARGVGYEERGMPTEVGGGGSSSSATDSPRKSTTACSSNKGLDFGRSQVLSWRGQRCVVVPPLLSDFRLAVLDPEVSGLPVLEETAREAARAAVNSTTQTAAAVDAVFDVLVTSPPVPPVKPPPPTGPLAALRRRRLSGGAEVEWSGVSAAWEPVSSSKTHCPSAAHAPGSSSAINKTTTTSSSSSKGVGAGSSSETRSLEQVRKERLPTLLLCVCDGHDHYEAAEFVSKALPLMAYRRLPQQLALVQAEHLRAAARSLFADVEVLLRRRTGTLRRAKAPGQTSGACVVASVVQGQLVYTFNLGDTGALFISLDVAAVAQRKAHPPTTASASASASASAQPSAEMASGSRANSRRNSATSSVASLSVGGGAGGSAASSTTGSFLCLSDAALSASGHLCPVGSHSSLADQEECAGGSVEESGIWSFREVPFRPFPGAGGSASGAGPLSALLLAKGQQQQQQQQQQQDQEKMQNEGRSVGALGQVPRAGGGGLRLGGANPSSFFPGSQSAPSLKALTAHCTPKRDRSFWGEGELDSPVVPFLSSVSTHQSPHGSSPNSTSSGGTGLSGVPSSAAAALSSASSSRELRVPTLANKSGGALPGNSTGTAGSPANSSGGGSPRLASRVMSVESVYSESRASEECSSAVGAESAQSVKPKTRHEGLRFQWLSRQLRCDNAFEQQRLRALGAQILSGRVGGIIEPTRTLGDFDVKERLPPGALSIEPDIGVYKVKTQGILILACDGVWDSVSTRDILKCMQSVKPLWRAVESALKRETDHLPLLSNARRAASASELVGGAGATLAHRMNASQIFPPPSAHPSGMRRIASWRRFVAPYGHVRQEAPATSESCIFGGDGTSAEATHRSEKEPQTSQPRDQPASASSSRKAEEPSLAFIEPPSSATLTALCKKIVRKAIKNGSLDDCTCVAAFITPASAVQSAPSASQR